MKKINYIPFAYADAQLNQNYKQIFDSFLEKKWYILGEEVRKFEESWANYCQTKFAVGVGNGYDALFLCLKTLGVGAGDEVIVPAHTFAATALAVLNAGATPVLVDAHPETFNIDPAQIEQKLTPKTAAILVVHLYGNPCDMDPIMNIAVANNLIVIEDNAQAHGAKYKGRKTGSFGDMSATSFYPVKNLGALGDGGAVNTNKKELYEKVKLLRSYGSPDKHIFEEAGVNSRLDELQAAFLNCKLEVLDEWNAERGKLAKFYFERLSDIDAVKTVSIPDYAESVYHIFPLLAEHRDQLRKFLIDNGVQTLCHYPLPYHLEKAFEHLGHKKGSFPITEMICERELSLPIFPGLSEDNVDYICRLVSKFFAEF